MDRAKSYQSIAGRFTILSQLIFNTQLVATFRDRPELDTLPIAPTMLPTGICSIRTSGVSSNVILISANSGEGNYSSLRDEQLIYLTTHEIAKAFGAPLDATGKEVCDQFQDENQTPRHFIMWPDVLRKVTEEEKKFSTCTIKKVHSTLSGCRTACFETNQHPFCGNGLVEEGEECDCGSAFNCSKQLCCYARSGKFPCRKTGVPCTNGSYGLFPFSIFIYTMPFLALPALWLFAIDARSNDL